MVKYVVFIFLFFVHITNVMEKKLGEVVKADKLNVERVKPEKLPQLEGHFLLVKINDNTYKYVQLGKQIGNAEYFQAYHCSNAGIPYKSDAFYKEIKQKKDSKK